MKSTHLLAALLSLAAASAASATDVGQHPAVFSPRSLPGIDASTFIPGHPARGTPGLAPTSAGQAPVASSEGTKGADTVTRVSAAKDPSQTATRSQ
ncbi:MAG TPA: hypothetical protein VLA16_19710 [Ideonella sp.]|nr:hypothetical protein [Ideonella sp.]